MKDDLCCTIHVADLDLEESDSSDEDDTDLTEDAGANAGEEDVNEGR